MLLTFATASVVFLAVAGSGLLGFLLSAIFWRPGGISFSTASRSVLVLVPARNEGVNLAQTLKALQSAASCAGIPIRIAVGADSCSDNTAEVARGFGCEVISLEHGSKWKTLVSLSSLAKSGEWVALVDSGAIWPERLIADLLPLFDNSQLLGIAPAYFPRKSSTLEKNLWRVEAGCKRRENSTGGPVSVHGATVFYRADVLQAAMSYLQAFKFEAWLNDDIALPMAARILFPRNRILYWCPAETNRRISDLGLNESASQLNRRKRMVIGNLQWMIALWPRALLLSPAVFMLAIRRVVRVFWAYLALLFLFIASAFTLGDGPIVFAAIAIVLILISTLLLLTGKRGIVEAAFASILAPFLIPFAWTSRRHRWS